MNELDIIKVANSHDPMGIEFKDNKIIFKVPLSFKVENNIKLNRKNLLLFIKSLNLAKTSHIDYGNKISKDIIGDVWPIDSYVWIIKDYIENGFYFNRDKKFNFNNGKVEWKQTIKQTPVISRNMNLIYPNLVTSKISYVDELITSAFKLCLKISQDRIGWAFNYAIKIDIKLNNSKEELINCIKKELNSTFDDIKRIRFKHMINILENIKSDDLNNGKKSYTISNYYYVFERMIDKMFKGLTGRELELYFPRGNWNMVGSNSKSIRPLEPDTIVKKNNKTFIIDAKMYNYAFTGKLDDLPETSSIQKQLSYGDQAQNVVDKNSKIFNLFLIPFDKTNLKLPNATYIKTKDENVIYIGYANGLWRNEKNNNLYDRIHTYLIDFNYVLNNYNKYDNDQMINELFEDVDYRNCVYDNQ